MLDLGMLYFNSDRRLTAPEVLDPFVVTENPQSLGDRLVDATGTALIANANFGVQRIGLPGRPARDRHTP
jgi:hypothetical protein